MTSTNSLYEPDELRGQPARGACAICRGQPVAITMTSVTDSDYFYNRGYDGITVAQRQWRLCTPCAQAVRREIERASLETPLRVAVAVALVASDCSPQARLPVWSAQYWREMDSATQDRLAMRALIAFLCWPVLIFVGTIALAAALH